MSCAAIRLEHAPGVLARHGEIARGPVRVGAEAEAVVVRRTSPRRDAVVVGVTITSGGRTARAS